MRARDVCAAAAAWALAAAAPAAEVSVRARYEPRQEHIGTRPALSDPDARAKRLRECVRSLGPRRFPTSHATDVVAHRADSKGAGFLYVDIVKATSSTIRAELSRLYNASFKAARSARLEGLRNATGRCSALRRTGRRAGTDCWSGAQVRAFFAVVWSFVRDPADKFESGVRQMWSQVPRTKLRYPTADDALDATLASYAKFTNASEGKPRPSYIRWPNEHVQPSLYRLSGRLSGGGQIWELVEFIGATETFDKDWGRIVTRISPGGPSTTRVEPRNTRSKPPPAASTGSAPHAASPARGAHLGQLSAVGVRKLCASELFAREYECFGYPWPPECAARRY